jgi:predicted nucleic acid-binding protein
LIVSTLSTDAEHVLDASVFVAAISPKEIHHVRARELYDSAPENHSFLVPALFRVVHRILSVRTPEKLETDA